MSEQHKPDYLDLDWSALIADRFEKWENMLTEYEARGVKKIPLWENQNYPVPHVEGFVPGLVLYPVHEEKRGMLVICAGGGFMFKSSNEAKEIADYFYEKGLNVAILDYAVKDPKCAGTTLSINPDVMKTACEDAKRAIRLLRYHADEWNICADKIGIGGFSAGGIITSLLLTHYDNGNSEHADPVERVSCRPDATFQMYGSFRNILDTSGGGLGLGFDFSAKHKTAETDVVLNLPLDLPPMFMAQTDSDDPVNLLDMGRAYYERGIPFEVHLFHGGPHGGGLYDGKHEDSPLFPHTAHWAELAAEWFAQQGF